MASLEAAVRVATRAGVTSDDVTTLLDSHDLERDSDGRIHCRVNARVVASPEIDRATNEQA